MLNKGQRSVKGLASGFEHVATLDLIMTMSAAPASASLKVASVTPDVAQVTRSLMAISSGTSPSHLYLELLRRGFREHWDLSRIDLRTVTATVLADGWDVDGKKGLLKRPGATSPSR